MFRYVALCLMLLALPLRAELYTYIDKDSHLYGFKDSKGKIVLKPRFKMVLDKGSIIFSPDDPNTQYIVTVYDGRSWYQVGPDGQILFESFFYDMGPDYYEEGLARYVKNDKVGFHDVKGKVVIPADYEFATPFRGGISYVCKGCWAEFEKTPKFSAARSTEFQLIYDEPIKIIGGKWGAIDKTGKVVLKLEHDSWERVYELMQGS